MRWRAVVLMVLAAPAVAAEIPDPLGSPIWPEIRTQVLGDGPVVFDSRVEVVAPANAEDTTAVPVSARVHGLDGVKSLVLFADYNPIPKILAFEPTDAEPFIATRFKINMATPVRAAALTADGVWHVGGAWVDAAGGGCTQPTATSANADWQSRLGEIRARAWPRPADHNKVGGSRVRFTLMHPMDTGLVGNIPAFYLSHTTLTTAAGRVLAEIESFEPVSENPTFSLDVHSRPDTAGFKLTARDNSGSEFSARIRQGGP